MGRAIEIKYKLEDLIIFSLTFQNLVSNYIRDERLIVPRSEI